MYWYLMKGAVQMGYANIWIQIYSNVLKGMEKIYTHVVLVHH